LGRAGAAVSTVKADWEKAAKIDTIDTVFQVASRDLPVDSPLSLWERARVRVLRFWRR